MNLVTLKHPRTRGVVGALVRAITALSFGCLGACGGGGGDAASTTTSPGQGAPLGLTVPFPPAPDSDPFYQQPNPMPDVAPGTILKSRAVTFAPVGGAPLPNAAWQLQFMSRDTNGHPIAAVATVVKPQSPASGVAPLVAYQYAEDALGNQCAPSHTTTGFTGEQLVCSGCACQLLSRADRWRPHQLSGHRRAQCHTVSVQPLCGGSANGPRWYADVQLAPTDTVVGERAKRRIAAQSSRNVLGRIWRELAAFARHRQCERPGRALRDVSGRTHQRGRVASQVIELLRTLPLPASPISGDVAQWLEIGRIAVGKAKGN